MTSFNDLNLYTIIYIKYINNPIYSVDQKFGYSWISRKQCNFEKKVSDKNYKV